MGQRSLSSHLCPGFEFDDAASFCHILSIGTVLIGTQHMLAFTSLLFVLSFTFHRQFLETWQSSIHGITRIDLDHLIIGSG